MNEFEVRAIGKVNYINGEFAITIDKQYIKALKGLDEFDYMNVIWWFDKCDDEKSRNLLTINKPYKKGPDIIGVFATRSPERPNPIGVTTVKILSVDEVNGIIYIPYIDAFEGTPILDIKPYTASIDRIEDLKTPEWCKHWPKNIETSGEFNWEDEFNF